MISGFPDVSLSPDTNIIYLWRDQDTSTNSRKNPKSFKTDYVCKSMTMLKRAGADNPDDPFNEILKIWDMRSISINKHEMDTW